MRYAGQDRVLAVPLPDGPVTAAMLEALAGGFAAAHQRMFGGAGEAGAVEAISFRVEAAGVVPKPRFQPRPDAGADATAARTGSRAVWLPEARRLGDLPGL